jgi:hypothetical protein
MTKNKNKGYTFYHVPKGLQKNKPSGCKVTKTKTIPGPGNLPKITVKTCQPPNKNKKK